MEFTLKEEIIDKLNQISESIEIIQQRRKGFQTVDDCLQSMFDYHQQDKNRLK